MSKQLVAKNKLFNKGLIVKKKTIDPYQSCHKGQDDKKIEDDLLKDVHANCFCASLLRTQIHMPRHA